MGAVNFTWIDRDTLNMYREEALSLWMNLSENKRNVSDMKTEIARLRTKVCNLQHLISQQEQKYLEITHKAFNIKDKEMK